MYISKHVGCSYELGKALVHGMVTFASQHEKTYSDKQQDIDNKFFELNMTERNHWISYVSLCVRKSTIWVSDQVRHKRAVQSQKMVRGWELWI